MSLEIRKVVTFCEEIRIDGRLADPPLRKAAAAAIVRNPYAGKPFSESLDEIVAPSAELGALLGKAAADAIGLPVESYGKASMVGTAGEQEHAVAIKTSVFGDAFRVAIGGATAWLPSVSKICGPGASVDVPLCYKDEVWVRSHYDAVTLTIADAPGPEEIVLAVAVASGGRVHARLGGKSKEQAAAGN